ncbi:diguanylate cyclase domain-containing protein [Niveispirillum fermenti]|uniref:GGDEF domain-containing protein n=1 Tax=Niveispirillum fermenti TaxID=1233113 RepID=UPI003A8BD858
MQQRSGIDPVAGTETALSGSLLRRFVLHLALWSMLVVLVLTAIGYSTIYDRTEREALGTLKAHLLERGRTESAIFQLAAANMETFRDRFLSLYTDPAILPAEKAAAAFDHYFYKDADGAVRTRRPFFDGVIDDDGLYRQGMSGFIGNKLRAVSPELQRRMVLTYRLLGEYGPAWSNRFINTTVSMPENAMVMYWPAFAWGLEVRADLDMTAFSVVNSTLQEANPARRPVWTPLYHDHTAKAWMVTYQLPVDHAGRHLINAGHDVLVQDLMDRLITDHLPGSYNFVLAADGHLVAHPLWMDRLRQELATINLEKLGDPGLLRTHALIRDSIAGRVTDLSSDDNVWIVVDKDDEAYLAVTRLDGPDWWFIARYPMALVADTAHQAASAIMLMGTAYFLAMLGLVFVLLRRQVAAPILQLKAASERVAAGDYAAVADGTQALPLEARDEIGLLARSFRSMAGHVRDANARLEGLVTLRTEALEAAHRQLQEWSLHDPLTGIHNRRAFESDLQSIFDLGRRQARSGFALVLADIDHFQAYNDAYGTAAGDQVLRTLFRVIARHVGQGDRVYRLGGAQAAIILTDNDAGHPEERLRRVLDAVQALALPHQRSPHGQVTLSAGLAIFDAAMADPAALVHQAQDRLDAARQARRKQQPAG